MNNRKDGKASSFPGALSLEKSNGEGHNTSGVPLILLSSRERLIS
jgi:hypothetical protein